MIYERSQDIERRLHQLVNLVRKGNYSTPTLAKRLGVSVPTVSRSLAALRQRGYIIRSVRQPQQWVYELVSEPGTAIPE